MKLQPTNHGPTGMLPHVNFARRVIVALGLSALLAGLACRDTEPEDMMEDQAEPIDVQAIVWCVLSHGSGKTDDGEEISVLTTGTNRGACLCLPIEVQPFSGSELDEILHQMALDKCEEDLRERGAVTTSCEEYIPDRSVDYETICDPDDWPPPPI